MFKKKLPVGTLADRPITMESRRRASVIPDPELGPTLDSLLMYTAGAIDNWRYRDGPGSDVSLAIDGIMAIWNEVERRGLG